MAEGIVDVAMLRLGIYFDLGMIRAQVTMSAVFGPSHLANGEPVLGVKAGAASQSSAGIHSADADIGPSLGDNAVFDLYRGTVAVITAGVAFDVRIHAVVQPGGDLPDDFHGAVNLFLPFPAGENRSLAMGEH